MFVIISCVVFQHFSEPRLGQTGSVKVHLCCILNRFQNKLLVRQSCPILCCMYIFKYVKILCSQLNASRLLKYNNTTLCLVSYATLSRRNIEWKICLFKSKLFSMIFSDLYTNVLLTRYQFKVITCEAINPDRPCMILYFKELHQMLSHKKYERYEIRKTCCIYQLNMVCSCCNWMG